MDIKKSKYLFYYIVIKENIKSYKENKNICEILKMNINEFLTKKTLTWMKQ